ncbi:MAG: hypothetical protein LBK63_03215 [Treponema sp.]|jgi:hypothetical protein|nr:hypothetical protein [Treponema sp.]
MKAITGFSFFLFFLVLGACDRAAIKSEYALDFPPLPAAWQEMLGDARWRLIWTDDQGVAQTMETGGEAAISVVSEWATPALAFPYWPGRGILPGEMRPAGAIFPFDVRGDRLQLSWRGGAEAWFYRELAAARNAALVEAGTGGGTAAAGAALDKRRPEYFDWPRFRSLLDSDAIPAAVREDPWKADWREVAIRTVQSGFDRRRISGQTTKELLAPGSELGDGPLAGPSPFARPLLPEPGLGYRFAVTNRSDTYVSADGILRVSGKTWIYYSFHAP